MSGRKKATAKKAQPKSNAGRPANSKTKERPEITITATPCHHCGSCNGVKDRRIVNEGKASGKYDGKRYQYFRHYHANCKDCNGAVLAREFDFLLDA